MGRLPLRFALGTALVMAAATALADVSITVGQPGFYGRIDIGDAPPPQLIYGQPLIIAPAPPGPVPPPIYLRVPPGFERHWAKHCRDYNACGSPVFFVRDKWYRDVYVPHYRERERRLHGERGREGGDRHGDRHDEGPGERRGREDREH